MRARGTVASRRYVRQRKVPAWARMGAKGRQERSKLQASKHSGADDVRVPCPNPYLLGWLAVAHVLAVRGPACSKRRFFLMDGRNDDGDGRLFGCVRFLWRFGGSGTDERSTDALCVALRHWTCV